MGRCAFGIALGASLLLTAPAALADGDAIPVPAADAAAQAQTPSGQNAASTGQPGQQGGYFASDKNPFPFRAWEAPAIDVPGVAKAAIREEDPVGEYGQPRWTAQRRFPTTRLYVLPKGKVETEVWVRYTAPFSKPGAGRELRNFWEWGFGIGNHLQLDLYIVTEQGGNDAAIELKREQFEIRWSPFDYGKVWGNPTLYLEYQHRNGSNDRLEPKILLGGQLAPRWHAGFNWVLERELGGEQENEWNLTGGISYTVVDQKFHVGAEAYAEVHDIADQRFKFADSEQLFLAGPSFMYSPIAPAHFLFSPLFGTGKDGGGDSLTGKFRLWFIFGWAL
ncbi:MAG: hypothetical protein U0359_02130 [Byssovorax sp.]